VAEEETRPAQVQVPTIYGNGFVLALSNADVGLVVTLDNLPQMKFAMSFTTAKSLLQKLSDMMDNLERVTNHTIMTSDEVAEGIKKISNAT